MLEPPTCAKNARAVGWRCEAAAIAVVDSLNPSTVGPALYLATAPNARRGVAAFTAGVAVVSLVGMYGSYRLDAPTGATVVCTFGLALFLLASGRALVVRLKTRNA